MMELNSAGVSLVFAGAVTLRLREGLRGCRGRSIPQRFSHPQCGKSPSRSSFTVRLTSLRRESSGCSRPSLRRQPTPRSGTPVRPRRDAGTEVLLQRVQTIKCSPVPKVDHSIARPKLIQGVEIGLVPGEVNVPTNEVLLPIIDCHSDSKNELAQSASHPDFSQGAAIMADTIR